MSDIKLGNLIAEKDSPLRDAIHIALAPVEAGDVLYPSDHVGLNAEGRAIPMGENNIGIVDPFLKTVIKPGQKFWMLLYQNTITGMRHEWSHPMFKDSKEELRKISREIINDFAKSIGVEYEELMAGAHAYLDKEKYMIDGGKFEGTELPEDFWQHFEVLTGRKGEGYFFSCSC